MSPAVEQGPAAPSAALVRGARRAVGRRGPGRVGARWLRGLRGAGGLRIGAAVTGGLLLSQSFAPHTWWWAAVLGLALFGLACHGRRLRPALGLGLLFGLAFYLPLLNWVTVYVGAVASALGIAEAVLTAPVAALVAAASRRLPAWPLAAAAAWLAGEALRARFPFGGFPWGSVAFAQADGPLLPVAALLGAPGLTFVTAGAGFAVADLLRRGWRRRTGVRVTVRPLVPALLALLLAAAAALGGRVAEVSAAGSPTSVIAVIQGNVPEPGLDFNAKRMAVTVLHADETHRLAADVRAGRAPKPRLVIWPENSSDIDPYTNADARAVIQSAVTDIGVPVLVGAVVGSGQATYNMGIVWDPVTGPGATYTKRHPVPFAEYMPLRSFFRIFSAWVDRAGYFVPGTTPGNLGVAGVPVGDVICFEVVYDDLVHDVVAGGAQVLVVQTNNATFGYTEETYQQQAMSRVRAVEYGREVLISSTSGVSAVIGPDGAVQSRIPLFTAGDLTPTVPLLTATTVGSVVGAPLEAVLSLGLLLLLAAVTVRSRARRGPGVRRTVVEPATAPDPTRPASEDPRP